MFSSKTWQYSAIHAIFLLVLASFCHASAFSSTNIDFLGRGGGTFGLVARTGDIDNVVWNASGLARSAESQGFAAYMDYLVQTRGGIAGYAGRHGEGLGYGLYMTYLSTGSVQRTAWDDPTGSGGEFTHGELVLGLSGGAGVASFLSLGGGFKAARQSTDDVTAGGMFADLSATARIYPIGGPGRGSDGYRSDYRVYSALVGRNLKILRWGDEGGSPPANLELGFALEAPGDAFKAGLSLYFAEESRRQIRAGLAVRPVEDFELRAGYRRRTGHLSDSANDLPWERGLSAGFSVGFDRVWVDYSFEDSSPLDNIHRFGIRSRTGPPE